MLRKFRSWFDRGGEDDLLFEPQVVTIKTRVYHLRKMSTDDIDAALDLERRIYAETPWDRVAFISELRKTAHSLYVVAETEDGQLAAYVGCWFSKDEAHITNIAVSPVFQHQGLGRFLMQEMIDRAIASGATKMTLEVRTDNVVAQALYHALGFKDGKIKKGYYVAHHEDAMDMWLPLN
ncbi:ribosomal protein S18-alanine N-acetyltransferase [Lacticaseibacillus mingshuiensis]|uniref:Ribosomal protein S18-alanine N-acetyltransferase n=1 Tax=Lacticaseibacillus mingshuiensis TaxID=2799574 RepID=A0ABW4CDY8_9LACO|nr:ribosomal protein S18-alanine N-acetyltransferase [Lacticaseibacillus mingshuiensis]